MKKRTEQRQKNKTKIEKTRYGDPFPHFDPSNKKYLSLPVPCNANKCKNVKDKSDIIYVLKRTCAFYSLCQIVSFTILNNNKYNQWTAQLDSGIFQCAKLLISGGLKGPIYNKRATTLKDISILHVERTEHCRNTKSRTNIIRIEGACNVGSLTSILFSTATSCYFIATCSQCEKETNKTAVLLQPNLMSLKNERLNTLNETF